MVQRVGERVAIAANRLYPNAVQGYKWKFALIKNEEMVNAWALPGGKCGIYTGLLPITENEDALAIVMAHEVAHVVARHGAERSSRAMVSTIIAGVAMKEMNKRDRTPCACCVWAWRCTAVFSWPRNRGRSTWSLHCCRCWLRPPPSNTTVEKNGKIGQEGAV